MTVCIVGGGIAGLAAGIALARAGKAVTIFERAPELAEIGAGLQLGPNAMHALESLGVLPRLAATLTSPQRLSIRSGHTGARLAEYDLSRMHDRYGARLTTVHRADLLSALAQAARGMPAIEIAVGERVEGVEGFERPRLRLGSGRTIECEAVIGADGLHSVVRASLSGREPPRLSGEVADRALVETLDVPSAPLDAVVLWLFPDGHAVHYPVRGGQLMNIVFVQRSLGEEGARPPYIDRFAPDLAQILAAAENWLRRDVADRDPAPSWGRGAVTLVGDAAHPCLPYLAQGAAMALEDAVVLGQVMPGGRTVEEAFSAYESLRRPRTNRIVREARRQGWIDHLAPPWSMARDLVIRAMPQAAFLQRLDWIYGWRQ